MPMQQLFSRYDLELQAEQPQFKYCPDCGTALQFKEQGDRARPTCPACGFVQYRNPLPGVSVVIVQDGRVLLGKRNGGYGPGMWGLPQGYIEFEESFLTAAVREVKEETGLDVEIRAILNVVSNHLTPRLHSLVIILYAEVKAGEARAADDLERLAWFPLAGPLPEMAFEADEAIIARVREMNPVRGLPVDPDFANG